MNGKTRFILCFLLICSRLPCRESFAQLPSIKFESITSEDGLPSNTVYSAMRDHQGFMWFGTRLCPVRYDGSSFKSFRAFETTFVTGLAEDAENKIWFASSESIVCTIDAYRQKMSPVKGTTSGGDFFIDSKGNGWYSDRKGVNRVDLTTGKQKHYAFAINKFIWNKGSFTEDHNHQLWVIGSDNGLFKYDAQNDSLICMLGSDCMDSLRNDQVLLTNAYADSQGILWIGSFDNGLIKYDLKSNAFEFFPTGRPDNAIMSVAEGVDDKGKRILWVGDNHGIGIFRPEQNKFYFFDDVKLGKFVVNDIFRDSVDGTVWVCTSVGIKKYDPTHDRIKTIALPSGLVNFPVTVNAVVQDLHHANDGIYYLGLSHTGMIRWDRAMNTFTLISFPSMPAETSWMTQRRDGTIWIGTLQWGYVRPGILVYDPAQERFIDTPLAQQANKRFSVPFFHNGFFDANDNLWIGNSDEGVRRFDGNTAAETTPWDSVTQQAFIKDENLINSVMQTKAGPILLGTYHGMYHGNEKLNRFVALDTAAALQNFRAVNSILEDTHGNIWTARWGALTQTSPEGKIKKILTVKDGFYDREIKGLAEDAHGNIWVGNWEGLYCYDPTNEQLLRFTMKDGLVNNNTANHVFAINGGRQLLVGQINSFNVVMIDPLLNLEDHSPLAISSFKVQDRDYFANFSAPIILQRADNSFSVDVVALNFRKEHENHYAYYLEGLEENWKYSGDNHVVRYTNLKPGEYILHIKAGDGIERWYDHALELQLEVLPAFYETWWFKILMVLVLTSILYALARFRINQILRLHHVQNRISADLHDELGASLSGISIMGTLAQNTMGKDEGALVFVKRMVEEVQVISGSLDDIVWNISPKHDTLSSLTARMTRYASELLEAKQIRYEFSFPENVEGIRLSMEQRRNFYLVFKESLNNLVKYSQCTLAIVAVIVSKKKIMMKIEDNGVGFDINQKSERNGIRNMVERSKKLHGTLRIESAQQKGTTLILEFPMK